MFKNVYFAVVAVLMQPYLCQGQMHALRDKILYDNVVFMSHPQSLLPYIADLSADDLLDGMVCVTTVECVDRFGKMVPGEKVSNNVIVCEHFPETKCYILKFGSNMNNDGPDPIANLQVSKQAEWCLDRRDSLRLGEEVLFWPSGSGQVVLRRYDLTGKSVGTRHVKLDAMQRIVQYENFGVYTRTWAPNNFLLSLIHERRNANSVSFRGYEKLWWYTEKIRYDFRDGRPQQIRVTRTFDGEPQKPRIETLYFTVEATDSLGRWIKIIKYEKNSKYQDGRKKVAEISRSIISLSEIRRAKEKKRLEVERQRQQRLAKEAEERRRREEERQRQEEERQRQVEERRRQVEERQRQVEILKQKEKQYITNYDLIERLYRKNPDSPFAAISASHKKRPIYDAYVKIRKYCGPTDDNLLAVQAVVIELAKKRTKQVEKRLKGISQVPELIRFFKEDALGLCK